MKKTGLLTFLILSNIVFSQSKLFIYEHKFVPDSTNKEKFESEIMILNLYNDKSEFYSSDKYQSDSTLLSDANRGVFSMPPNKKMNNDRIIKYKNSNVITYITTVSNTKYFVSQDVDMKWDLKSEFDKILGYDVQKATLRFGGRDWIAWFSKEIPIQDGPYKFFNLPGLILKIEDINKNHIFELKEIRNSRLNFIYPNLNNYKEVNISYPKFEKIYKIYRKNPTADLVGKMPDQRDAEGNFRTGAEILRDMEKRELERISKDNNILEIDLLKQK